VLLELARSGKLQIPSGIIRTISLDAGQINEALDGLGKSQRFHSRR